MLFQDALQERQRHAALLELGLLADPAPPEFEEICHIARYQFQVSIAVVTVVDGDRVLVRGKSGTDASEMPRHQAFSDHAVRSERVFVVEDALADPQFASTALERPGRQIRFFAGAPLRYHEHVLLGALCLLDPRPRTFSLGDRAELEEMADELVSVLIRRDIEKGPGLLK